jgi:hypothetical protein
VYSTRSRQKEYKKLFISKKAKPTGSAWIQKGNDTASELGSHETGLSNRSGSQGKITPV